MRAMLTETEIFDCLETNLRLAAEDCDILAMRKGFDGTLAGTGFAYTRLCERLKLVEGACRQAGHWREHAAWFPVGLKMAEAASRVQSFVRHREPAEAFRLLAQGLRIGLTACRQLRHRKTGRVGMILPAPLPGPHRDHRPVQVLLPGAA